MPVLFVFFKFEISQGKHMQPSLHVCCHKLKCTDVFGVTFFFFFLKVWLLAVGERSRETERGHI